MKYCAGKCRSPYRGGCAEHNRECTYTELDASCGDCISGYSEVEGSCVQGELVKYGSCTVNDAYGVATNYISDHESDPTQK